MNLYGKRILKKTGIILFWIVIWQMLSLWISNKIIMVGPLEVLHALQTQVVTMVFWSTIVHSLCRIMLGFFAAFVLGIFLGGLSFKYPIAGEFLSPLVSLMKSVPVASFVILALIWIGSKNLSVFVAAVVVFPIIYVNTREGFASTDIKLLEMARVFRVSSLKKLWYIYRPALAPFLLGGCKVALGMSWKSGVAAEVIGVPASSIGEALYMSKIYLNTEGLFAWTLVIILLSMVMEQGCLWLLKKILK